jgi:antitoxin VapB
MAFHIRDKETDAVVRKLAERRGVSLTKAVHDAALRELQSFPVENIAERRASLASRLLPIQQEFAAFKRTGLKADKAFYDSLSDEE